MRVALAVILAIAFAAVAVNGANRHVEIPSSVRLGYFSGRSGNVVFTESQMKAPSASASFVDPSGRFVESSLIPSSFSLYDIANTIALAFGTVVPGVAKQASFNAPFLKTDVFSRPLASIMVGVKELSQEDVQALNLNSLKATMAVTGAAQPYDSLSAAVSLSTANPPTVHGVIAKQWKNSAGEEITAFGGDRLRSTPQVASLADIVAQTFDGRSTIVSASADSQYASAFCPRFSLRQAHPEWNTICFGYKNHQFADSDNAAAGSESKQEILDRFARGLFPTIANVKITYSAETKQFEVTAPNAAPVTFSMADHESFALFAELQFISDLVAKIDSLATARDEVPDLYAFTISALEGVVARFGQNSVQFRAAAVLVDGVVGHVMSRLFATYNNRVLASVVTWGHVHHRSSDNVATEKAVVSSVLESLGALSDFSWPVGSLHISGAPLSKVCDELSNGLSAFDVQVHCPTLSPAPVSSFIESSVRTNLRTLADAPSDNDVQRYQIALWFSIGIVLVLFAAIYSVCYMDLKADTLLYSKFNPHWKKNH